AANLTVAVSILGAFGLMTLATCAAPTLTFCFARCSTICLGVQSACWAWTARIKSLLFVSAAGATVVLVVVGAFFLAMIVSPTRGLFVVRRELGRHDIRR